MQDTNIDSFPNFLSLKKAIKCKRMISENMKIKKNTLRYSKDLSKGNLKEFQTCDPKLRGKLCLKKLDKLNSIWINNYSTIEEKDKPRNYRNNLKLNSDEKSIQNKIYRSESTKRPSVIAKILDLALKGRRNIMSIENKMKSNNDKLKQKIKYNKKDYILKIRQAHFQISSKLNIPCHNNNYELESYKSKLKPENYNPIIINNLKFVDEKNLKKFSEIKKNYQRNEAILKEIQGFQNEINLHQDLCKRKPLVEIIEPDNTLKKIGKFPFFEITIKRKTNL